MTTVTAAHFLDTIFQDRGPDKEHICVSKGFKTDDGMGFWNVRPSSNTFIRRKDDEAWYFCVSTVNGEMNEKKTALRRRTADVVAAHCLVLDDIGTKASEPPVEPSWKLESSEANFQWGYALEPTTDFKRYEALVEWCHDQGWGDAGAGGCYRIMRVPGSCNIKPGRNNFISVVTHWNEDEVWSLDGLAKELGCDAAALDEYASRAKGKSSMTKTGGVIAKEGIDPMMDWLSAEGHVVRDNPEWVDVICPWADSHTSGGNTGGYSPLGRGDGDWVQTRAYRCLHEHCKKRKIGDFVKWAEEKGGPWVAGYDPLPWLQDRYAYLGMEERVADLHQRKFGGEWIWDLPAWSKRNPGKLPVAGEKTKIKVAAAFVASRDTKHVDASVYVPVSTADDHGIVTVKGQEMLNMYVPPNWAETDELPTMFIEHMDYLIPCDREREHFIDWLAFKFQYPELRSYAVVMVADGVYGTGRSWIKDALTKALQGKVNTASLAQLIGKGTSAEQNYNNWMAGCQFLIVEEAKETMDRDAFFHGYENFKKLIDNRVPNERINGKFERTRYENIYFNALIFTNHSDALALPDNDRRVYVVTNAARLNTPEYYDRLAAALDDKASRSLFWYLMRRDVSYFEDVYPPMTPGKMAMIEQNRAPSDVILDHIREVAVSDIVTKKDLRGLVVAAAQALDFDKIMMSPEGVLKHVWGALGMLKDGKNGYRVRVNDAQIQVRALRDKVKWRSVVLTEAGVGVKEEMDKAQKGVIFPQSSQ